MGRFPVSIDIQACPFKELPGSAGVFSGISRTVALVWQQSTGAKWVLGSQEVSGDLSTHFNCRCQNYAPCSLPLSGAPLLWSRLCHTPVSNEQNPLNHFTFFFFGRCWLVLPLCSCQDLK